MNEAHELVSAMLAIAFAAVMLVIGQLYIENRSMQAPTTSSAAQVALREAGLR